MECFDGVLEVSICLHHLGIDEMVDGVIPHLEVVAQPHLEAALGVHEVSLVQLNLSHQKVTVSIRGVDIVQDVLEGAHGGLEVARQELGLGQEVEGVLEAGARLGHRLQHHQGLLKGGGDGLALGGGGVGGVHQVLLHQLHHEVGVHGREVLGPEGEAAHRPEVRLDGLVEAGHDLLRAGLGVAAQQRRHVEDLRLVDLAGAALDLLQEVELLLGDVELSVLQLARDDAAQCLDRGLVQLGGRPVVALRLLHAPAQQVLAADLRHRHRARGVYRGGLLGEHGGHLQDAGVAAADAGEQLRVHEEYQRVLGLGALELCVELAELQVGVLVHALPADRLQHLELEAVDVLGVGAEDPVDGLVRLVPVLQRQLHLHLLHQRRREALVDHDQLVQQLYGLVKLAAHGVVLRLAEYGLNIPVVGLQHGLEVLQRILIGTLPEEGHLHPPLQNEPLFGLGVDLEQPVHVLLRLVRPVDVQQEGAGVVESLHIRHDNHNFHGMSVLKDQISQCPEKAPN